MRSHNIGIGAGSRRPARRRGASGSPYQRISMREGDRKVFLIMYSFLRRFHRAEEGVIAIMVGLLLVVLLGFAAFAVDLSHGYFTQTQLQVTASAAALAGAGQITDADENGVDDTDQYRRAAVEYATAIWRKRNTAISCERYAVPITYPLERSREEASART